MSALDPKLEPYRAMQAGPGRFVVEGAFAVERLLASGLAIESIVCTPSQRAKLAIPAGVPVFERSKPELVALTGFDFHRGVLACAWRPETRASLSPSERDRLRVGARLRVVVAEQIVDPRNLGALVRNLAAFAGDLLVADAHGADPFSRQAIRAGVGNVFRTPLLISEDLPGTIAELARELDATVLAATPAGELELGKFEPPERLILLVGNEGSGLSSALLDAADRRVRIPIAPDSDSVNVAAATAVLLYALG